MLQAGGIVKTSAHLADLQGSHEIDWDSVAVVRQPCIEVTFTVESLTFRHLETELVAPYGSLAGHFAILHPIVPEINVTNVVVAGVGHRVTSAGRELGSVHVAD